METRVLTDGRRGILSKTLADFGKILFASGVAGGFFMKLSVALKAGFVLSLLGCVMVAVVFAPDKDKGGS